MSLPLAPWRFDGVGTRLKNIVLISLTHSPMTRILTMRYPMTGISIHIEYLCVCMFMCQGVAVTVRPKARPRNGNQGSPMKSGLLEQEPDLLDNSHGLERRIWN